MGFAKAQPILRLLHDTIWWPWNYPDISAMIENSAEDIVRPKLSDFIERECRKLGVRSICPYEAPCGDGEATLFAAYLPQFGSKAGILVDVYVPSKKAVPSRQADVAKGLGIPVSFVNFGQLESNPGSFIEALVDWGYQGKPDDLRDDTRKLLLGS